MSRIVNIDRSLQLQHFLELIGHDRKPFIETGRKFDKIFIDGEVRYFIARMPNEKGTILEGDIYGAKSHLAPNFRWYFGNLANIDKWDWSAKHGKPEHDTSVMAVKEYKDYIHWRKIPEQK